MAASSRRPPPPPRSPATAASSRRPTAPLSMAAALAAVVQTASVASAVALALAVLPGLYAGELFPWHPLLMAVGYLGFMAEGILSAHRFRTMDGAPRAAAIANHSLVQGAAAGCALAGFAAIYANKALHGKPHFSTLHGKCGALALITAVGAPALGAVSFRALGLLGRLPPAAQPTVKWAHRLLGAVAWALGLVAMQLDLPHPAVMTGATCRLWQAASLAAGGGMLAVLRRPPPGKALLPQSVNFAMVPQGVPAPSGSAKHL